MGVGYFEARFTPLEIIKKDLVYDGYLKKMENSKQRAANAPSNKKPIGAKM